MKKEIKHVVSVNYFVNWHIENSKLILEDGNSFEFDSKSNPINGIRSFINNKANKILFVSVSRQKVHLYDLKVA